MDKFSYFTRSDLTYNNYYSPCPVEIVYNTILIPIHKYAEFEHIELPSKITIKNSLLKATFEQSLVFDNGVIEIKNF